MSTRRCPRCRVGVHPVHDRSSVKWHWRKGKKANIPSYVCKACESELMAKLKDKPVVYTITQDHRAVNSSQPLKLKLKKIRRKKKLCPQCNEVWFLIGLSVYPDRQYPLVCSKPCRRKYLKEQDNVREAQPR